MKLRVFGNGAIYFLATVLAPLPAMASNEVYKAVYFQPPVSGATRIPHSSGSGGFLPLNTPALNYQTPIGSNLGNFNVTLSAPPQVTIGNDNYVLSYASITGANEGGAVAQPDPGGLLPTHISVQVGTADIDVTYVYFPAGRPCISSNTSSCNDRGSAAIIGEVGEADAAVLYDYFVTVFSPEASTVTDVALTKTGNDLGVVDTTSQAVRINADAPPLGVAANNALGAPRPLIFDRWESGPGGTIGAETRDLDAGKGTGLYALALYRANCPANYHWNATSTVSQCVANVCANNQFWNSAENKCMTGCAPGTTCTVYKCPAQCRNSCLVVPPGVGFNHSNHPVFACEPING
jgi:hypothetical protein